MATYREIKIEDLIHIRDPQGQTRVLGQWPGDVAGPKRAMVNRIVGSTEKLLRAAYDIRGNRNFGPIEAGERLREASGPMLKELNEHATALRQQKESLRDAVRAIAPTQSYAESGHWQAAVDMRVLDAFNALPVAEKAAMKHQLLMEPALNTPLADAMLRLPRMVTGLEHSDWQTIRVNLLRGLNRPEFDGLSQQMAQTNFAQTALRVAVEAAMETTGTRADLMEHAPAALALQATAPIDWKS